MSQTLLELMLATAPDCDCLGSGCAKCESLVPSRLLHQKSKDPSLHPEGRRILIEAATNQAVHESLKRFTSHPEWEDTLV